MKKLLVVCFMFLFPLVVNAEECSQEQLNSYIPFVEQAVITPKKLGDSNTYEIWASNVKGGIALEKGRTVFDSGFLGYASADENVIIRAYVADGGICAGKTIKEINVTMPKAVQEVVDLPKTDDNTNNNDNNDQNNNDNNNQNNNENNVVTPPVVNQDENTIKKPTIDVVEEPIVNINNDDKANNDIKNNSSDKKEETMLDIRTNEDIKSDNEKQAKKKTDNSKMIYIAIASFGVALISIIIYLIKKRKTIKTS